MQAHRSKIRILTFHHIPNNGAFLFVYSLTRLLQREFNKFEINVLDYKSSRLASHEYIKRFKVFQGIPLFYMNRARMWDGQVKSYLDLDRNFPHFASEKKIQHYFANHYNMLVVGMDIWCVINGTERPKFPNIYWLPEKMAIPKVAYGVSSYNSNPTLIKQSSAKISAYLNNFDVIGARDRFTYQLVKDHRSRSDGVVELIPDPTFTYEIENTGVVEKLIQFGVELNRPIIGLLLFGDLKLSNTIVSHYKAKGYQVLALSMYNSLADINLGHLLTPFEWAEAFRYLSFCVTDRFHGTIFCLKNHIPFVSLESDRYLPRDQSKIYDLLTGFGLETCYENPGDENFNVDRFLSHADEIEVEWDHEFKPGIQPRINAINLEHTEFISKMKLELRKWKLDC